MNPYLTSISKFVDQFYNFEMDQDLAFKSLRDSLSTGQMRSKYQIVDYCRQAQLKSESAVFIGHWHGLLPLLMKSEGLISSAIGIETSALWSDFSNRLNCNWDWRSHHQDIHGYSYDPKTDLVVNTSCEHMSDQWLNAVPRGCRVLVQSTNYEHTEHVNRKMSLEEFKKSLSAIQIVFEDVIDCQVYLRYTVFGIKN